MFSCSGHSMSILNPLGALEWLVTFGNRSAGGIFARVSLQKFSSIIHKEMRRR